MRWFKFAAGLLGTVGVAWQMPAEFSGWLVGLAFLTILVSSFFD